MDPAFKCLTCFAAFVRNHRYVVKYSDAGAITLLRKQKQGEDENEQDSKQSRKHKSLVCQ